MTFLRLLRCKFHFSSSVCLGYNSTNYYSTSEIKKIFNGGAMNTKTQSFLHNHENRGLFGLEGLNNPRDFPRMSKDAIRKTKELYNDVIQQGNEKLTKSTALRILSSLDDMSETICSVADAAEVCRQTHTDRSWLEGANKAHQELHHLIAELNTDNSMLLASQPIVETSAVYDSLSTGEKLVSTSFVEEFKSHGLHADERTRQEIISAENKINREISIAEDLMYKDAQNYSNNKILDQFQRIVAAREHLAAVLGKKSFADLTMSRHSCFKSPNEAVSFLERLSDQLKEASTSIPKNVAPVQMNEYFTLGGCMDGLSLLVKNLFGLQLRVTEFGKGEAWTGLGTRAAPVRAIDDLFRIEILEEDSSLAGVVYLDLFPRSGKIEGGATFAINFSTEQNGWQVPHAVAALNIEKAGGPMHFSNVVTLFHEFGHVLHTLLSRTKYQHLAGVRCPTDFVEMPSTFMENFLRDYNFVSLFARHWINGNVLPREVFQRHNIYQISQNFEDSQQSLLKSLFDLTVHGNLSPGKSWGEIEKEILAQHSLDSRFRSLSLPNFHHLIYYGSAFYCYLLCTVYSSTIYKEKFKHDPLSLETGQQYRQLILAKGGEGNAAQMINNFLGDSRSLLDLNHSVFAFDEQ